MPTIKELLEKSKSKLSKPSTTVASKPADKKQALPKVNHGKVVNYYVEYEDGTALLAQGKHAHLIYRFTLEAQELATMHAFAYYEGPSMKEMTKAEAIELIENAIESPVGE